MFLTMSGVVFFSVFGLVAGKQPLSLGASLLGLSLGVAGVVGCQYSSWLGFLVLIVYSGGMMIMFSYVCCLASNCFFVIGRWTGLVFFVNWMVMSVYLVNWWLWEEGMFSGGDYSVIGNSGVLECGSFMFSDSYFGAVLSLGCILFLVMVGVVKLCQLDSGPLRPF
uniref:NADH-ubiquinone oxidoreductase chain 6 n=1 Tax=Cucullaea labiata TaxID=142556 RepID=A0A141AX72_9BIVA|nr:NADH dehydrogenase subunit 6 [Cucullaea labiata]